MKKNLLYILLFLNCARVFAQTPNLSYSAPQYFTINTAITPLTPVNTGGAVPATVYGQVSTFFTAPSDPHGITIDASGNLYVIGNTGVKLTPAGVYTASTPGAGGGIAIDAAGNFYLPNLTAGNIYKLTPANVSTIWAGNTSGSTGDAVGQGTLAAFNHPSGIVIDPSGNLYLADSYNTKVKKITPGALVSTVATGVGTPYGIALDATGNIYVGTDNDIKMISTTGVVTRVAGTGKSGALNGPAASATFNYVTGLAVDGIGNIYAADKNNSLIRLVSTDGTVSTLAGGNSVYNANGVGTAAGFNGPHGVVLDGNGNLFACDNNGVRKIVVTGYAISPSTLPAGLSFDATTGIISGTPTGVFTPAIYTITGYNTKGKSSVNVTLSSIYPGASSAVTLPATSLTSTGATLNGTVIANGSSTNVTIEYGTSPTLAGSSIATLTTGTGTIPAGTGNVNYTSVLSGLTTGATYYYRINGSNASGTSQGNIVSFTTTGTAPTATTNAATSVTAYTAVLNGVVNDNGTATTVSIEYSTAADMSNSVIAPITTGTSPIPAATGNVSFTSLVTTLNTATTYYYRIRGVNTVGTTLGNIQSFTTTSVAPIVTSYSPASGAVGTLVTINGSNLSYTTSFTIGGAQAIVISSSQTQLVGMVMPGAVSGNVTIATKGGTVNAGSFAVSSTPYPSAQVGNKLVANDATVNSVQGSSVAVSADGNTAVVCGFADQYIDGGPQEGATWVYTKTAGIWSQQGKKLVGAPQSSFQQGGSVAISADGNTIITGDYLANYAWIFTRSAGVWTKQGGFLQGSDATGSVTSGGVSVGISGDGNTAILGWNYDNSNTGAAWIFNRANGVWTQLGNKIVGTATTVPKQQGTSVCLSADGKTAAVGCTNNVLIYANTAGVWAQQGSPLAATSGGATIELGFSTALSADGNTLIAGEPIYNSQVGAAFVFTRTGTTWAQQSILAGNDAVGTPNEGRSVAISADGNTALVGGFFDNNQAGATWVYTRSGSTWAQQGSKLVGAGAVLKSGSGGILQGLWVALSANGGTAIVGGPGDNNTGAAWIFGVSGTKSSQTITFAATASATYGAADIVPAATSTNSTIPITYTSSNPAVATITSGSNIHIVGAGTTTITASQASNTYFDAATPVGQTLTVNQATLTITANNQTKFYGAANPALTISYSGFVNSDTQASLTTAATASTTAVLTSPVGSYPITATGAVGANYSFSYVAGSLSVTAAPAPTITAFTPNTAITSNTVTITGTYLLGATAVSLGGVAASSFTIVSPTSITAIVGVGASGNVSVTTPTGTGVLAGFNYVFTLPATNFKITNTSATCKGSSNGSVNVTAGQPFSGQTLNYVATITGNGLNTAYPLTTTADINNLAAGTYNICLTVTGQTGYQQCFTAVITEPKDLSLYASVSKGTSEVVLSLGGAATYNINLNGTVTTTTNSQIVLPLKNGVNSLTVSTDKICQGEISENIELGDQLLVYPNPFENSVSVSLGSDNVKAATVKVYDAFSRTVFSQQYANRSGVLQINLSDLIPGVYMLSLSADGKETAFKIIKK